MDFYKRKEEGYHIEAYQFNGDVYTIPEKLRWLLKKTGMESNRDWKKYIVFIDPSCYLSGILVNETEWITADMKVYTDEAFKLAFEPLSVQKLMSYDEAVEFTKQGQIIRPINNTAELVNLYLKEVDGRLHIFLYDNEDIGPYLPNDDDYKVRWIVEDEATRVFDPATLEAVKKAGELLLEVEDSEVINNG